MRALLVMAVVSMGSTTAMADEAAKKDTCHISVGKGDVMQKRGDIVIESGRTVENVIALQGKVTVKKGAKVKSVLAVKGDVLIEAGAEVTESIVAIGGTAKVDPDAIVHGSQISLTDGLSVKGDSGKALKGDFSIDGESLSQMVLKQALKKIEGCVISLSN